MLTKEQGGEVGLKRGTVVKAARNLDPRGAKVREGDLGVVYGEANCYGDDAGPIVRWLKVSGDFVELAGTCNVYDGDVEVVQEPD